MGVVSAVADGVPLDGEEIVWAKSIGDGALGVGAEKV